MIDFLTDSQLTELGKNPAYTRFSGKCPVCQNTGEYTFDGIRHECPQDAWGRHEMHEMFKRYTLANIPLEFQQLSWDDYPYPEVKAKIDQYVEHFNTIRLSGMGWEIYGKKKGVGKTWAATGILKALVDAGYTGWFIQFPDVKNYYDMDDRKERDRLIGKLRQSEVLVIDEVLRPYASEKQASFYEDVLEAIIRFRTTNNFPTIITTNMVEKDISEIFPRVYSLLSAKQWRIELHGDDYRVTEAFYSNEDLALKGEVRPIA